MNKDKLTERLQALVDIAAEVFDRNWGDGEAAGNPEAVIGLVQALAALGEADVVPEPELEFSPSFPNGKAPERFRG